MVIIPHDVYKTLIEKDRVLLKPLDNALIDINKDLSELFSNNAYTSEEKNARYDQMIKKIKHLMGERNENSLDTKLSNIVQAIPEPPKPAIRIRGRPRKIRGTIKVKRESEIKTPEADRQEAAEPKAPPPEEEQFMTPPPKINTMPTPAHLPMRNEKRQREKDLLNYVTEHAERFGISKDQRIVKDSGSPYKGSSVEKIINYMISEKNSGKQKPAGYQQFYNLIKADSTASSFLTTPKRGKGFPFKPKLWNLY